MTYLYKNGKVVCVELRLDPKATIHVKEMNVNIQVTVRRFKDSDKMKIFIVSDRSLTIPQYLRLQKKIKESWREHEAIQYDNQLHKERKGLVTA